MDYDSKHSKYVYQIVHSNGKKLKFKKKKNSQYDPDVLPDIRPPDCKGHVCFDCLRDKCEHFSYTDIQESLRKKLTKTIHKFF
jgi:hypothetical protein